MACCNCREPVNLCLIKGFGRIVRVRVKQSNAAADLTDWTAKLQVRNTAGTVLLELTSDVDGGIVIDLVLGWITATFTATKTSDEALTVGEHRWGLAFSLPDREPPDPIEGYCTVRSSPVVL